MECCHTLCHWYSVCVYRSVSATKVAFVVNWCAVNVKVVIIFTGLRFHVFYDHLTPSLWYLNRVSAYVYSQCRHVVVINTYIHTYINT